MKNLIRIAISVLAILGLTPRTNAQDDVSKVMSGAIKQANEAAKKVSVKMQDVEKMMDDDGQEEAKEKAARQAVLAAPGPAALPTWTPKTLQFTPAGPVARKLIDEKPVTALSGTSPLTPAELADGWEKSDPGEQLRHSRNNLSINGTETVILYLRTRTDPSQELCLEAKHAPGEKITHVSITAPLLLPKTGEED